MNRNEIESDLKLELPVNFEKLDMCNQELIVRYLNNLNSIERQAYQIGIKHLGTSFNVLKSNGFNDWKKTLKT
jgi:hypothetical protein